MGSDTWIQPATALDALADVLDLAPARDGAAAAEGRTRLGVVAGRSGPRFLVPLGHPRAAPQACLAYLGLRTPRTRVQRGAVGLGLRLRLGRLVTSGEVTASTEPGSLLAGLAGFLGQDEVAVGVGLGTVDEVWKPTLQVFATDGRPLAFVKVGLGPVAADLVATEAATLARWTRHPDPRLVVPRLLADTTWRGIRLVAVEPLPTDSRRLPGPVGAWAVRTLDGPPTIAPLADAPWWTARRARFADHPAVDAILGTIELRHGDMPHEWARWHGDWVPWNLARCHRGTVAWDWEYSEPDAPVELDEVHGAYQVARVAEGRDVSAALAAARQAAPSPWVADAHVAMLVTRSAALAERLGREPHDQAELFAAAREAATRP